MPNPYESPKFDCQHGELHHQNVTPARPAFRVLAAIVGAVMTWGSLHSVAMFWPTEFFWQMLPMSLFSLVFAFYLFRIAIRGHMTIWKQRSKLSAPKQRGEE